MNDTTFAVGDRVRVVNAGGRWKAMGSATIGGGDASSFTVVFDAEPDADYRFTPDELERLDGSEVDGDLAGAPVSAPDELAALRTQVNVLETIIERQSLYIREWAQRIVALECGARFSGPTRRRRVAIKKMAKGYQWEGTSEIDGAGPGVDLDALQDAELTAIDRAARRAIDAAEYIDANGLPGYDEVHGTPDDEPF